MSASPRFELVPLERLRVHEAVDPEDVRKLVGILRSAGEVHEPLLVAESSYVILNGHHRFQALRLLGARCAPAWVVDYADPRIELGRWGPGDPISKSDVLRHAEDHLPFPVKTTRHTVRIPLAEHPTPLAALGVPAAAAAAKPPR